MVCIDEDVLSLRITQVRRLCDFNQSSKPRRTPYFNAYIQRIGMPKNQICISCLKVARFLQCVRHATQASLLSSEQHFIRTRNSHVTKAKISFNIRAATAAIIYPLTLTASCPQRPPSQSGPNRPWAGPTHRSSTQGTGRAASPSRTSPRGSGPWRC